MKRFSAIILLVLFSFQTFYAIGFMAWFHLNRDSISKTLCINKSKPQLKCKGKCYLNKKLKEKEKQENSPLNEQTKLALEFLPTTTTELPAITPVGFPPRIYSPHPTAGYHFKLSRGIFHPPSMSV